MVIQTTPAIPIATAAARVRCAAAIEKLATEARCQYHPTLDDPQMRRKILAPMPGHAEFFAKKQSARLPDVCDWSIQAYTVPVLTDAQEYHLFRRMNYHKRRIARAIEPLRPTFGDLSAARAVVAMCDDWQRAAQADRNLIAEANMRACYKLAARYIRFEGEQRQHEILSSCQRTLMGCINSFTWHRGTKLSTYFYASAPRNVARDLRSTAAAQLSAIEDTETIRSPDDDDETTELRAANAARLAEILESASLSERETAVVTLYHGLDGPSLNHKQIGDRYGLTKEWSRKTLIRALGKLRQAAGVA